MTAIETVLPHYPELLAPAGSWDCAKAAVENGADAIYFGLDRFNARMRADNFTEADLPELMAFLHGRGVKGYITLNTLIFTAELPEVETYLRSVIAAGVDAAIVQDIGLCRLIRHLSPDFPIHASTQMSISSALGVEFARDLGCQLVVLARESSLQDLEKIQSQLQASAMSLPLEVFVHGALCVAYSGQCLTSEALGGRSANRGECAQACRMPYDLIVDGEELDLGDRHYLLSPQDLAGLSVLPELVKVGVSSLKIEGRLKTPDYVASVTRVYRQALDRVMTQQLQQYQPSKQEQYQLEMAFSRGLYSGWFRGIDNQALVHARFGKKRGIYVGEVVEVRKQQIIVQAVAPIKPGNGVVFDHGTSAQKEEGGRVYTVDQRGDRVILSFGKHDLNLKRIHVGDRLWKTSDHDLEKQVRQTYAGDQPKFKRPIFLQAHGQLGQPLMVIAQDEQGHQVKVASSMPLTQAERQPLTVDKLETQWSRLGNTPFQLGRLDAHLVGDLMLPVSELNRMRREWVAGLVAARSRPRRWHHHAEAQYFDLLPEPMDTDELGDSELIVLVRTFEQLQGAIATGVPTIYCEFEDPRRYREAMQIIQDQGRDRPTFWVAPPRMTKPKENWILDQVKRSAADGYLIRNYDHLRYFAGERCIADFSFNISNPITAQYFQQTFKLERLTASYDLNIQQLSDLIDNCPAHWFEITLHQHMPMFHMEHCVFCAFLSEGKDFTDCGRPCETHQVKLRDRVGTEHVLHADSGCRNTVFNGNAQTGAESIRQLEEMGARHFRIELLQESQSETEQVIEKYQQLLARTLSGTQLWQALHLQNQLGVTRGTLTNA